MCEKFEEKNVYAHLDTYPHFSQDLVIKVLGIKYNS